MRNTNSLSSSARTASNRSSCFPVSCAIISLNYYRQRTFLFDCSKVIIPRIGGGNVASMFDYLYRESLSRAEHRVWILSDLQQRLPENTKRCLKPEFRILNCWNVRRTRSGILAMQYSPGRTAIYYPYNVQGCNGKTEKEADFGILPQPKNDENMSRYKAYVSNGWSTSYTIPCKNPQVLL